MTDQSTTLTPALDPDSSAASGTLRITLVRSTIGRPADQGRTVRSLGIRKLQHTVERPDNPSIRGMVRKIRHLVSVEEVPET
ncbi:MAG: 50S ribosomal protein L30 [Chloroflexia bacterium]|nr:50S ribosomal protein L30 [Chloroflexia bacterium]